MKSAPRKQNELVMWVFDVAPADRPSEPRAECMTVKADCCPTTRTCATAWMWTVWAASTPVPSAAHASAAWSAAATGSGFTSRWKWRAERLSGTSLLYSWQRLWEWKLWLYRILYKVTDIYQVLLRLLPMVEKCAECWICVLFLFYVFCQ